MNVRPIDNTATLIRVRDAYAAFVDNPRDTEARKIIMDFVATCLRLSSVACSAFEPATPTARKVLREERLRA